ncbi:MAG: DNA recombination protein RmuC, partial [Sphingomonas echinoides]
MTGVTMALFGVAALLVGLAIGFLLGIRGTAQARAERDARNEDFKRAIVDLASAEERARETAHLRTELAAIRDERDVARLENTALKTHSSAFESRLAEMREADEARLQMVRETHEARIAELLHAKELLATQFAEVSNKLLNEAQEVFLKRADERFRQSEETAGQNLKSMLQPVSDRLLKYEEAVTKVESERLSAFDQLKGQLE